MRPFTVIFHREPNEFKDYTDLKPVLPNKEIDVEAFKKKLDLIDRIDCCTNSNLKSNITNSKER